MAGVARRPDPCVADMSNVRSGVQCRPSESPNRHRTEPFDEVPDGESDIDDPSNVSTVRQLTVVAPPISVSIASTTDTTVPAPATDGRADAKGGDRRLLRKGIRGGMSAVTVAVMVFFVVTKRGALTSSIGRLGHPDWSWIPIALVLEAVSMATFASMQSLLLRAGGTRIRHRPMMATIYAANALAVSVPVAGPELGTAFTFRRFTKQGADTSLASWALLVGGLVSSVGAILVLAVGGALSGNVLVTGLAIGAGLTVAAVGAAVRTAVGRPNLPLGLERPTTWMVQRIARLLLHPIEDPSEAIRRWLKGLESLRLSPSEWSEVGGLGMTNWLADAGVLAISLLAIGAPVPWRTLLLIYGLAAAVGSLGITPGGIGLVEGTLCLGLVSTGVPTALALAAVLLYRLVSFWLVSAVGWLVLLYLRLGRVARPESIPGGVAL
jgi:putative heme transporter